MHIYFSLGTNLGDKEQNLRLAVQHIEERIGKIVSLSAFYAFLNAAVCAETSLPPLEILSITQSVEQEMGRTHKSVNGEYKDRVIDIDLLIYGDLILDTPILKLPHPLMQERRFVMEPLAEIAPDVRHPVLGKTLGDIYRDLTD